MPLTIRQIQQTVLAGLVAEAAYLGVAPDQIVPTKRDPPGFAPALCVSVEPDAHRIDEQGRTGTSRALVIILCLAGAETTENEATLEAIELAERALKVARQVLDNSGVRPQNKPDAVRFVEQFSDACMASVAMTCNYISSAE